MLKLKVNELLIQCCEMETKRCSVSRIVIAGVKFIRRL